MGVTAAQLIAKVSTQGASETTAQLLGLGQATDATQAKFSGLAAAGAVIAGALIAVGAKASQMAGDYQAAVLRLYTTAGESKNALGMIGSGVLSMSTQVGTGAQTLIQAMYFVESAGFHGKQGLDVLRIAAMGAKAENSDLTSVVKTLVSTLNSYAGTGLTTAGAMNTLIAAVSQGHMTLNDLAGAISNVLPATAHFGISLLDTTAAIAEMTKQGDNASSAATHLRQMILALEAPTRAGAAALKAVGLTTQEVSDKMKQSLPAAIQMITEAVGKKFPAGSAEYNKAIRDIAGGSRQMMGFLELSGVHAKDFADIVRAMAGQVKQGGSSIMGWSAVQQSFNFKLDQAKAAVEAFMIRLGTGLLPVLGRLLGVVPQVVDYISNFGQHANVLIPIIAGLIGAAIVPLTVAVWSLAAGVIAATWPFILIGAAVAGAAAVFMHFYQTSGPFKSFIDNLVTGVKQVASTIQQNFLPALRQAGTWLHDNVLPVLQQIGSFLLSTFKPLWEQLVQVWNGQILPSLKQLWAALQPLLPVFKAIAMVIGGVLVVALIGLVAMIAGVVKAIAGFLGGVAVVIGGIVQVITGVVQVISGIVSFIVDLFTGHFERLGGDLGRIWDGIKNIFAGALNIIKGIVQAVLGAIWGYISGWGGTIFGIFHGVFDAIGTKVRDILTGIKNWVGNIFSQIGTKIHDALTGIATFFLSKWNDLLTFVKSIPGKIGAALSTLAGVLLAPFKWFYDHNTYVKEAVDAIHQKLTDLKNLVGDIFNWIGSKIHDVLTFIKNIIGDDFNWIGSKIHDTLTTAKNLVGSIFGLIGLVIHQKLTDAKNFVGTIFSQIGSSIHDKLTDVKNFIGNIFSTIGTLMHDKLTAAWNNLVSFASGWPSAAFQWGVNLITGLINGLGSMLGALKDKAGQIAGAIAGSLGFHSPAKEGPGRDADKWAPNFMHMYAAGLAAGIPRVRGLLAQAMTPLAMSTMATLSLQASSSLRPGGFSPSFAGGVPYRFPLAGAPVVNITVQSPDMVIDGYRLTRALMPHTINLIRARTNTKF